MDKHGMSEIDRRRSRGGAADIGTKEDGAIQETITLNERAILIKERSIYEFVLADTLDPKRENPHLPSSVHTKLLSRGSEDKLVACTFLTAKALFPSSKYPETIDITKIMLYMLDVVKELAAMEGEIEAYNMEHNKACNHYEARSEALGFMLPSIPDMLTRCKTIFQKGDQACQYLMCVIRLLYPEIANNQYYTDFQDLMRRQYGEGDHFCTFLNKVIPFIMEIRIARNCVEHQRAELKLNQFELQQDGSILASTIEMDHRGAVIPRQDVRSYLSSTLNVLIAVIETMLPYLATKFIQPMGRIVPEIREVPLEKRRNKLVKFGVWLPLGEEGFYKQ